MVTGHRYTCYLIWRPAQWSSSPFHRYRYDCRRRRRGRANQLRETAASSGSRGHGVAGRGRRCKEVFQCERNLRIKKALLVFCHVVEINYVTVWETGRQTVDQWWSPSVQRTHSPRKSSFSLLLRCTFPILTRSPPLLGLSTKRFFYGNTKPTGDSFGFALCPSSRKTIETTTVRFDLAVARSVSFYSYPTYAVNRKTIHIRIRTVNYIPFIFKTVASWFLWSREEV